MSADVVSADFFALKLFMILRTFFTQTCVYDIESANEEKAKTKLKKISKSSDLSKKTKRL